MINIHKLKIANRHSLAVQGADFMGKIRPTYIKRIAIDLVKNHHDQFTDDFQHNKRKVAELTDVKSVSLRNKIAGYITRYRKNFET